jgi:hypothetical protein
MEQIMARLLVEIRTTQQVMTVGQKEMRDGQELRKDEMVAKIW